MLELVIIFTAIVIIPFITYCIVVFMDHHSNIEYMRDYVLYLKTHYSKIYFLFPVLNTAISILYLITLILSGVLSLWRMIVAHIPKNRFMDKCSTKWDKFTEWFMNIKIK